MELVGEEEIKQVLDVLQSGYLYRYQVGQDARFQGKVGKLEQEMARRSQVRHALAVNSGTTALMVALVGRGVRPGETTGLPPYPQGWTRTRSPGTMANVVDIRGAMNRGL